MTPAPFYIVFDVPPGPEPDLHFFFDVETAEGVSVGPDDTGADWQEREDGYWTLGPFNTFDVANPIDFLLDGLDVETISDLHRLVRKGKLMEYIEKTLA